MLCSSLARAEGVNVTKLMLMSVCYKHIPTVYSTEIYGLVRGLGKCCSLVLLNGRIDRMKHETVYLKNYVCGVT